MQTRPTTVGLRVSSPSSFASGERISTAVQGLAALGHVELGLDCRGVFRRELEAEEPPIKLLGDGECSATAGERVEDDFTGIRASADDSAQDLLGHLAAVPASALFERTTDARDVPAVAFGSKAVRDILWAEDPGVIQYPSLRIGTRVKVD